MLMLPPRIAAKIEGKHYTPDTIGMSGANILYFDDMVLKIERACEESKRALEMLHWLAGRLPVPRILAAETDHGYDYLLMTRLTGEMACTESILSSPQALAALLAEGLNMLWQVDVSTCPYSALLDEKLHQAEARVAARLCTMEDAEPGTYGTADLKTRKLCSRGLRRIDRMKRPFFPMVIFACPTFLCRKEKSADSWI